VLENAVVNTLSDRLDDLGVPESVRLIEYPSAIWLWVLEGALANGDFELARRADSKLREFGVTVRVNRGATTSALRLAKAEERAHV